jgi:hypothetical protein
MESQIMDDLVGGIFVALLLVLAALGLFFVFAGVPEAAVVRHCKDHGYWQTGQTRVICSVEERK